MYSMLLCWDPRADCGHAAPADRLQPDSHSQGVQDRE